jgi:pimeloyl-ACP methyl ester carboxylesterase
MNDMASGRSVQASGYPSSPRVADSTSNCSAKVTAAVLPTFYNRAKLGGYKLTIPSTRSFYCARLRMNARLSLMALVLAAPAFTAQPAARRGTADTPAMPRAARSTILANGAPAVRGSIQGTPACTEVVDDACKEPMSVGAFTFWYYRSYTLSMPEIPNPDVTRAVIVIHGMERNASNYFANVTAVLHNDQDPSLVVIAPHFKGFVSTSPTCQDSRLEGELYWSCSGPSTSINRWDDGGEPHNRGAAGLFSFRMIDLLIGNLTAKFPNLAKITIAGHSDGAQFTQRYAAGNLTEPVTGVAIKYVVANPGSYMYLDNTRLPKGETCLPSGCTVPPPSFTAAWDPDLVCPDSYNNYKYGLDARTFGYMDASQPGFSPDEVQARFLSRRVAYVLGDLDQEANFQLDISCPANAQGMHLLNDGSGFIGGRRERGAIFWNYVLQLGADPTLHTLTPVPNCGHNVDWCMFKSAEMIQEIMF